MVCVWKVARGKKPISCDSIAQSRAASSVLKGPKVLQPPSRSQREAMNMKTVGSVLPLIYRRCSNSDKVNVCMAVMPNPLGQGINAPGHLCQIGSIDLIFLRSFDGSNV